MSALRWGLCCLLTLGFATSAAAKGVRGVSPDGKKGWLHTVEPGDTLWDITETYLGSAWIWPTVWKDNGDIPNPHRIEPGDLIWITEKEIRKLTPREVEQIRIGEPEDEVATSTQAETPAPATAVPAEPPDAYMDPFAALDRSEDEMRRLIDFPGLHRMGFVTPEELEGTAAILGSHDENYWASQERTTIIGIGEGRVHIGDQFTVYRTRRRVDHPETGETLGYLVDRLGTAEVTEIHEESSFVRILRSYSEIEPGDRVVPYVAEPREFVTVYEGDPKSGAVVGMPIHRQYALNGDVVVIDHGTEAGVVEGREFEVFRPGKEVRDPVSTTHVLVPDSVVGRLVVVKASATSSLALLTKTTQPIRIGDHYRSL